MTASATTIESYLTVRSTLSVAILVFLLTLLILVPSPTYAQWSAEGVQLFNLGETGFDCCPDGDGGAWVVIKYNESLDTARVYLQHINSEGVLSFDLPGMLVQENASTWLFGIESGLDGDCVVMYSVDMEIYAQRVTQQGERVWGETGIPISPRNEPIKMPFVGYSTISDNSGGFWGFWSSSPWVEDVWVCGVNWDGSLKYPTNDLFLGYGLSQFDFRAVPDGLGGFVAIQGGLADGNPAAVRHILAQHVFSDGSTRFDEPQIVMDWPEDDIGGYTDPFHIRRDPQGGFIITSYHWWQRLTNELVPEWDIRGVRVYEWDPPFYNLDDVSTPVIMADRSVAQICTNPEFSDLFLEQVSLDGTRPQNTDWGPVAGDTVSHTHAFPGPDLLAMDGASLISIVRGTYGPGEPHGRIVQRINMNGESLWPSPLYFGNVDEGFSPYYFENSVFHLDDESIAYIYGYNGNGPRYLYIRKLLVDDGVFADSGNSVEEGDDHNLPTTSAFISNAYPNPFNSTTTLEFAVRQPGVYELVLVNVLGQVVDQHSLELVAGVQRHQIAAPDGWPSGIYFVQLRQCDTAFSTRKVLLLR